MEVCQLRLINELNVTTEIVDFLSYPFASPLNLKIPKATKRTVETADNMFRDGSDLSLIRYNNAVITMQPRFKFDCTGQEALSKIESLRHKIDSILEAARNRSVLGYGETVEFWDDSKGFVLTSKIIDGNFDIEEDWDWSNVGQGAVLATSFALTREPFRTPPERIYLENYCPNPGFEDSAAGIPSEWTLINGASISVATDQYIEGAQSGRFACVVSAVNDTIVASANIPLIAGTVYYVEAWVSAFQSDPVIMEIYRPVSSTILSPTVSFVSLQVPVVADDGRFFRDRRYNTWSDHKGFAFNPVGFNRKGFTFTAPATDDYQIRFRVDKPSGPGDNLIDRVYLTPVSNLPITLPTGLTLDLSLDTKETADMRANFFPTGWISHRDIVNHHDDGSTDHFASASASPSGSKSPSASASTSPSKSASPSASQSNSPSASQSKSPSASSSPSASISQSPSSSASASVSPSTAIPATTGYHINYVDFYDIPGDIPAECKIRVENTSGANLTQIFAGLRSFGSPAHQTHTAQIGATPDTDAGAGNKSVYGPLSATPTAMTDNFGLSHSLNGLGNNTGAFRMLVRIKDLAAVQGKLRMRTFNQLMTGNTGYNNTDITPPGPGAAKWSLIDAGVNTIPLLSPDGSIQNFDGGVSLVVVWRISGTENIEVDYCQFFPADEYFCAASPTWDNGLFVNLNSLPGFPTCFLERYVSAIDIRMRQIPAQATSQPHLMPKRQNRLFLSVTRALGEHVLTDSMRVQAQVLPRYL
jgi:hypothetical protein